jgi:hypothetical protein
MKKRVINISLVPEMVSQGFTQRQIAYKLGVSLSTLKRANGFREAYREGLGKITDRLKEECPFPDDDTEYIDSLSELLEERLGDISELDNILITNIEPLPYEEEILEFCKIKQEDFENLFS